MVSAAGCSHLSLAGSGRPAYNRQSMAADPTLYQGIARTAAILRACAGFGRQGARLTDVARATGLSKSTAHRFLAGLVQVGLLEQDGDTGCFYLGFDLVALGSVAADRFGIAELARPSLQRLANRTADTVLLTVRSGAQSVCVDRHEGDYPIKTLSVAVADRRPLGVGAGGLALLAGLGDAEVERVIERNAGALSAYPVYTPAFLYEQVALTRRQGFAFNEGSVLPDMYAVGVAIRGAGNEPVGALSVAAIVSRMQPERRRTIIEWLTGEARELERRLAATRPEASR